MFITCNHLPTFGDETENVYKRLSVYHTKAIRNPVLDAPKWIEENAMDCLVWLINTINRNKNLLFKNERFYEREHDDFIMVKEKSETLELEKLFHVNIDDISIDPVPTSSVADCAGPSGIQDEYDATVPEWIRRLRKRGNLNFSLFFPNRIFSLYLSYTKHNI